MFVCLLYVVNCSVVLRACLFVCCSVNPFAACFAGSKRQSVSVGAEIELQMR